MSTPICNGGNTYPYGPWCHGGGKQHETVRMHEQIAAGAVCPICGGEYVPTVGIIRD